MNIQKCWPKIFLQKPRGQKTIIHCIYVVGFMVSVIDSCHDSVLHVYIMVSAGCLQLIWRFLNVTVPTTNFLLQKGENLVEYNKIEYFLPSINSAQRDTLLWYVSASAKYCLKIKNKKKYIMSIVPYKYNLTEYCWNRSPGRLFRQICFFRAKLSVTYVAKWIYCLQLTQNYSGTPQWTLHSVNLLICILFSDLQQCIVKLLREIAQHCMKCCVASIKSLARSAL